MMKRNFLHFLVMIAVVAVGATGLSFKSKVDLSAYKISEEAFCYYVPNEKESLLLDDTEDDNYQLFLGKTYIGFKEALGFKESQGRYEIVNTYGYLGKYQFNKNTLAMIGIYNSDGFLEDTRLQEDAFHAYTARNKWILRRDIKRYAGRYVGGVKITESGILAAAHLAGAGNVKKYLRSGGLYDFSDAFGTSIKYYLKKFSGYDTSFVIPEKMPKVL